MIWSLLTGSPCGAIIKIGDEKLLTAVTECLNMAIADTR